MTNERRVIDYIEDRYGDGECGVFAQALNGMTGLPVVLFRIDGNHYGPIFPNSFPRHAAVLIGHGRFLDGFGISSLAQTTERFGMRLRVDFSPSLSAYPFQSGPGQQYFDQENFSEVETDALSMLVARNLDDMVGDQEIERIVAADERELLSEFPRIGDRMARPTL